LNSPRAIRQTLACIETEKVALGVGSGCLIFLDSEIHRIDAKSNFRLPREILADLTHTNRPFFIRKFAAHRAPFKRTTRQAIRLASETETGTPTSPTLSTCKQAKRCQLHRRHKRQLNRKVRSRLSANWFPLQNALTDLLNQLSLVTYCFLIN